MIFQSMDLYVLCVLLRRNHDFVLRTIRISCRFSRKQNEPGTKAPCSCQAAERQSPLLPDHLTGALNHRIVTSLFIWLVVGPPL